MNPSQNEQTELLRNIWAEMKSLGSNLGGRIDQTNTRLDAMRTELRAEIGAVRTELDAVGTGLGEKIDLTNARLAAVESTVAEAAAQQVFIGRTLRNIAERDHIAISHLTGRHEREAANVAGDIGELRRRIEVCEDKLDVERG